MFQQSVADPQCVGVRASSELHVHERGYTIIRLRQTDHLEQSGVRLRSMR